jgi:hypothetical protein
MAWPNDPYPIKTEFLIDGAWTDYSSRVRADGRITITRGQADQQSGISPTTSDFTLNSRDGLFSNRNPGSPLYRKFGRNTQVRHSVLNAAGSLDAYFLKTYQLTGGGTWFSTADKAVLDIVSDIDVRFEVTPATWKPSLPQVIGGKWNGAQTSWMVTLMPTGLLRFSWANAALAQFSATSTTGFAAASGRYALRVTLDVDNGSGSRVVAFYWSTSLAGSWTLLGTTTTAGTTAVYSSTAALEVGGANGNGSSPYGGEIGFVGKVHGAEVYQGIAGTIRARFDPTGQAIGATTWSDGLATPNTWTLNGTSGRITSDRIRFVGELSSLPQKWDLTGRDVYLPVRASGALRRMMQGGAALHSALYRTFINYTLINGYWPMEAGTAATKPDNTVKGNTSSVRDVSFTGSTPAGLAGSAGSVRFNNSESRMFLYSPGRTSTSNTSFIMYFKLTSLPATSKTLLRISGNTIAMLDMQIGPTAFTFNVIDFDGVLTATSGAVLFGSGASPLNQWLGLSISLSQEGGNVRWEIVWHAVGTSIFYSPVVGGATFAGTVGRFGKVTLGFETENAWASAEFAHVLLTRGDVQLDGGTDQNASKGYAGETVGARMLRLADEEGLAFDFYGDPDTTELMGPQTPSKIIDLWQDAASVDGGVLSEARDMVRMQYVTRQQLGQAPPLGLNYGAHDLAATPEPVDDDRYLLNDITASRPAGSSARAVLEEGALSIQDPPNGVGVYEGTISKNAADDDQLESLANWELFVRTWDEARVPNVVIGLHRGAYATDALRVNGVLAADVGSPITITDLPAFLPPDDMTLLAFGYQEVLEQKLWTLTFNTVPFGPYRTFRIGSGISATDMPRLAASETAPTVLNAALNTTATSIVINTPTGYPKWVNTTSHAAEFPFDVQLGGERITVTACTTGSTVGGNWQQTLTATRSINGVVKSHLAGAEIDLWDIATLGLGA